MHCRWTRSKGELSYSTVFFLVFLDQELTPYRDSSYCGPLTPLRTVTTFLPDPDQNYHHVCTPVHLDPSAAENSRRRRKFYGRRKSAVNIAAGYNLQLFLSRRIFFDRFRPRFYFTAHILLTAVSQTLCKTTKRTW